MNNKNLIWNNSIRNELNNLRTDYVRYESNNIKSEYAHNIKFEYTSSSRNVRN